MTKEIEGEAQRPPPPADYSAAPATPVRKSWPVLLAQALRTGHFVNAQVALVGAVECKVPGPDTVLTIGDRWQVKHSDLRHVRAQLSTGQQDAVRDYIQRDDALERFTDQDGRAQYTHVAPPLAPGELAALQQFWSLLHREQVLTRISPVRWGEKSSPLPPTGVDLE